MIWPVVFFGKVINHLGRYSKGWAIVTAFVAWITGIIPVLVTTVMNQIQQLFATLTFSQFQNIDFSAMASIGLINAVLPLSEMLTVITIYTTMWITVIVIRWIKSFVPTIAN